MVLDQDPRHAHLLAAQEARATTRRTPATSPPSAASASASRRAEPGARPLDSGPAPGRRAEAPPPGSGPRQPVRAPPPHSRTSRPEGTVRRRLNSTLAVVLVVIAVFGVSLVIVETRTISNSAQESVDSEAVRLVSIVDSRLHRRRAGHPGGPRRADRAPSATPGSTIPGQPADRDRRAARRRASSAAGAAASRARPYASRSPAPR